jgi:putative ABC transport system ATP-binding protein
VDAVVKLRNVHKTYLLGTEGVPALRGVSLTVARGEFIVILGKSGGGKSTMLNIIGTIDRPTRGDMLLCGERVTAETPDSVLARIRLAHCSYVFQAFNLIPTLTATENVTLPMTIGGFQGDRRGRAQYLLRAVGLEHRLDHKPAQMSGGEQQRVTIARSLANDPELLLADEPTGDLDSSNSAIVMKLITDLNIDKGMTVVMVTHDRALKAFAHRVVHMVDGKISHIEEVPTRTRQEALRVLAEAPAVQAMLAAQAAEEEEGVAPATGIQLQPTVPQDTTSVPLAAVSTPAPQAAPGGGAATVRPNTQIRKPGHYAAFRYTATRREVMRHPAVGELRTADEL